ncbi:MAG TPA: hypothetical protein VJ874_04140 [Candidatus Thermoplasmatota archaeon]|nr:hypothetical protein [Candidatus Thermoplasmatota archaeon]
MAARWSVALCLLSMMIAGSGCLDPAGGPAAELDATSTQLRLHCLGDQGIPTLESSYFGSCWAHIGHHTYFVGPAVTLVGLAGTVSAVEITGTSLAEDPQLAVETSLDGQAWTQVGVIPYPLGEDASDRYEIPVNLTTEPTAFQFLRVRMPRSVHEGLAGYLDHSDLTASVQPGGASGAVVVSRTGDCSDGAVMEDFFPEHPCWFGGIDVVDRTQGGAPQHSQVGASQTEESWYDSPSFLHTYLLAGGPGGALEATVRPQLWRLAHYAGRCSALDPLHASPSVVVLAQASSDGVAWAEVARGSTQTDEPVRLQGTVQDGAMFLRFGADRGPAWDFGGCHHPTAFLVDSSFSLGPAPA